MFISYCPDECTDNQQRTIINFSKDVFLKDMTNKTGINKNLPEYKAKSLAEMDY